MARTASECESLARRYDADTSLGTALERARALENQGADCAGTGMSDVLLAFLYQDGAALDDADRVARHALEKATPYRPNLLHVLAQGELRRGHVDAAYEMGRTITQDFPKYAPIYGFLGGIDYSLKRWDQALANAQRANEIDGSAVSLIAMATSLYKLNRHEEVVKATNRALELEPNRIARATGVTEAVFSLAALGRRDEAAALLQRHIAANPDWRQSRALVAAARQLHVVDD